MTAPTTESLYDQHSSNWSRSERIVLSDFTARPFVLEAMGPLGGLHVLDLGCGEGYVSRLAAEAGAASVTGLDISSSMVAQARDAVPQNSTCEFRFEAGNAAQPRDLGRAQFDRVMAVFLFNYLTIDEMRTVMKMVRGMLPPGGRFVFSVPHPCYAWMRSTEPPFYFDTAGQSYLAGVDTQFEGRIWRRDGVDVPVRCVHKTFENYFSALIDAGFTNMPQLKELHVQAEHLELDADFFGPLQGYPLHVLFRLEVS